MDEAIFERLTFSVVFAQRRDVGEEWNDVVWDKWHRHIGCHRLYFLTDGEATLRLIDKTLTLRPGVIYLIPAYSVVESRISGRMNKYYVHFQTDEQAFSLFRYLSDSYEVPADGLTEGLFEAIVNNYTVDTQTARMRVQGAMNILLSGFLERAHSSAIELEKFSGVLNYIEENFSESIDLSHLASMMNISRTYFSNFFKATFRISPKQYILNRRLSEAQRLLIESRMSVGEIARAVGFENENYFSEFFAARTGISALKFRRSKIPRERESIL